MNPHTNQPTDQPTNQTRKLVKCIATSLSSRALCASEWFSVPHCWFFCPPCAFCTSPSRGFLNNHSWARCRLNFCTVEFNGVVKIPTYRNNGAVILARACGVPTVVIWAVSFGRSTAGNDVVATILISLFRFPPFSLFSPFSPFFFLHCYLFSSKESSDQKLI